MHSLFQFLPGEPEGLLHLSAYLNDLPTMKRLLDGGEAIDLPDPQSGRTALMYALLAENQEIVEELVASGANVNAIDKNGESPLIFANALATTLLAKNGARLDASYEYLSDNKYSPMKRSTTPLIWSVENGKLVKVQALIRAGVQLDYSPYIDGITPLILALHDDNIEIAKALLEGGANPNEREKEHGTTPAFFAGVDSIPMLVEYGADLNLVGYRMPYLNQTPLMMAISNRSIERARVLTENGADVNYMDKDYCSALTEAVDINSIPMVQLLIDRGANVNPPMPHGKYTPLMCAIFSNYYDMIECLIMNGAMVVDLELDLARQEDDSDMPEYLQLCVDLHSRNAA